VVTFNVSFVYLLLVRSYCAPAIDLDRYAVSGFYLILLAAALRVVFVPGMRTVHHYGILPNSIVR